MTNYSYKTLSPQIKERNIALCEKYKNGTTIEELAKEYNLTKTYTTTLLVKYGLYDRGKRRTKAELQDEAGETLYMNEVIAGIKKAFPVGKEFRIKEFKFINKTRTHIGYRYYKVTKHHKHCIHLTELKKVKTENGFELREKGRYSNYSPSYITLYLSLKYGVSENE